MRNGTHKRHSVWRCCWPLTLVALILAPLSDPAAHSQTASTGALTGVALDPSGAALPGVILHLTKQDSSEEKSAISGDNGRFDFLLLSSGIYALQASKADSKPVSQPDIHVHVTETLRLELHLALANRVEQAQVSAVPLMAQLDTSALGRVVNKGTVAGLPLVTRNFTQIAGLSPGVAAGVYNAGELGTGATALSQIGKSNDGVFVHGSRSYDNNWQLDGISVSDVQGSGSISGGIPIPNPDMLEEFKVQTGLYDASFGRGAGANVSAITKSGTNAYHGTIFEFLRNDVLNANDYFLEPDGAAPAKASKQNQFGFALGGPIQRTNCFFFTSYQGTRQVNGAAAGQERIACTSTCRCSAHQATDRPRHLGNNSAAWQRHWGALRLVLTDRTSTPVAFCALEFQTARRQLLDSDTSNG